MQEILPLDVIIELSDCSVWQQDHLVLTNVDLSVRKGEFIYLVGRVGSGKSSLIKTLNAQIPLKEGIGLVAGYNLSKLKKRDIPYLRRKIGIVFQDFQLLTDRSVKTSLKRTASERLGKTGIVISSGSRFFDISLASRITLYLQMSISA